MECGGPHCDAGRAIFPRILRKGGGAHVTVVSVGYYQRVTLYSSFWDGVPDNCDRRPKIIRRQSYHTQHAQSSNSTCHEARIYITAVRTHCAAWPSPAHFPGFNGYISCSLDGRGFTPSPPMMSVTGLISSTCKEVVSVPVLPCQYRRTTTHKPLQGFVYVHFSVGVAATCVVLTCAR